MESCKVDNDCGRYNYCNSSEECVHDDIFPVKGIEVAGYIIIGIFLGLQNVGGLGAGTVKIFVLIMMLNYSFTQSTSYTYPCLLGSKIADNMMLLFRKHPVFKEKPIIDFNIVLIFLPSVLLGGAIGAQFNSIIPKFILHLIVIIFITFALVLTCKKVMIFLKKRKQQQLNQNQQQQVHSEQETENNQNNIAEQNNCTEAQKQNIDLQSNNELNIVEKQPEQKLQVTSIDNQDVSEQDKENLEKLAQSEKKTPLKKIGVLVSIFILLFLLYGFTGGKKGASFVGISFCSAGYWVLFAVQFPFYALFFYFIKKLLQKEEDIKEKAKYQNKEFEITYIGQGLSKFILNGFGCGFIDGLVGFGGPLLIIPTMVSLGLHPRSATASTSFLTIFSAGITIIIAILGGQVKTDALIFLLIVSFVGATIFTVILNKLVDYFKLDNLTIIFTAIVQFALLGSSFGLFINDLVKINISELMESSDYC